MKEREIKLRVTDLSAMRNRLRSLHFEEIRPREFEDNWVYDSPEQALRNARSLLRIRKAGQRFVVTFKGPPEADVTYKIREEIESGVADGPALQEIFLRLGLQVTFRYQKYRSQFRPTNEEGQVLLDETPIGNFAELEGSANFIDRVASQLGYSPNEYILKSYLALYLESGLTEETGANAMVFKSAVKD